MQSDPKEQLQVSILSLAESYSNCFPGDNCDSSFDLQTATWFNSGDKDTTKIVPVISRGVSTQSYFILTTACEGGLISLKTE